MNSKLTIFSIVTAQTPDSEFYIQMTEEMRSYAEEKGFALKTAFPDNFSSEWFLRETKGCAGAVIGSEIYDKETILKLDSDFRILSRFGIGWDAVDLAAATKKGIAVSNTPGSNSASVAEHALTLMLSLYKRINENNANVRNGQWTELIGSELEGSTVGLLGFGSVGRKLASILRCFSCRILAYDTDFQRASAEELEVEYSGLNELLNKSDILSLHIPSNSMTAGIVNKEFIARMKTGSILINTARGELVDESALYEALQSKKLNGAGLDVFREEPLTADSPLIGCENVIFSPHTAACTSQSLKRTYYMALDNIMDFIRKGNCSNILNPDYNRYL